MVQENEIVVNPENEWRIESTRPKTWQKGVRQGDVNKYFMISCDTHLNPPVTLFRDQLDAKWHHLLPRVEKRDNGDRFIIMPGARPERLIDFPFQGEDLLRSRAGGDTMSAPGSGVVGLQRIVDQEMDGVDGEVIFPNGPALLMWSSGDSDFVSAQCSVWNDWVWDVCGPYVDRCSPAAALCTADIEGAVHEVQRVAQKGFRVLTLPCKPIWGEHDVSHINYNLPVFDPLWAAIQDADLTITYHVSTGKDPRAARGNGGAIINYVVHSLAPTIEPVVSMCASGVFERFPKLRVASIEADAGWVPWMMSKMDEAYRKHHFWVRPKMKRLPSEYYRSNCYASFGEDDSALALVEQFGLEDNFMWANDYPHHEGSWPHSAESIERSFGEGLKETTRAKLLGLNAAKAFRFPIPERYRD